MDCGLSVVSLLPEYESGAGVVWLLQAEVKTQFKRFSCNYFIVGYLSKSVALMKCPAVDVGQAGLVESVGQVKSVGQVGSVGLCTDRCAGVRH